MSDYWLTNIRTGTGKITEVQVDAFSGKVISVEVENAAQEAAEKQQEMKKTP